MLCLVGPRVDVLAKLYISLTEDILWQKPSAIFVPNDCESLLMADGVWLDFPTIVVVAYQLLHLVCQSQINNAIRLILLMYSAIFVQEQGLVSSRLIFRALQKFNYF